MLKIKPIALALIGIAATQASTVLADNAQQLQKEIQQVSAQEKQLQQEIVALRKKRADEATSTTTPAQDKILLNESTEKAVHAYSYVRLGSYLAQQLKFDGSELVINAPSVLEAQDLLEQRYDQNMKSKKAGYPAEETPYLVLSGILEGQAAFKKPTGGANSASDVDLTDAEIAMQMVMSKWVTGLFTVAYDNDVDGYSNGYNRVSQSRLYLRKAFITLGNLMYSPVYGSIGQMYLPFGRYSYGSVSSPLTEALGRTQARAISLGYYQKAPNGFGAHVYAFNATRGTSNQENRIGNFGADLAYHFAAKNGLSGHVGAGYISNLFDSQGMLDNGMHGAPDYAAGSPAFAGYGWLTGSANKKVGGYDAFGKVSYKQFGVIAEFVTASTAFNSDNMFFGTSTAGGPGAKPKAFDLEGSYSFKLGNLASAFVLDYGFTRQALALNLPRTRYSGTLNFDVWKDTVFSLEYRHDVMYGADKVAGVITPTSTPIVKGTGKSDNAVTAQLDMYF